MQLIELQRRIQLIEMNSNKSEIWQRGIWWMNWLNLNFLDGRLEPAEFEEFPDVPATEFGGIVVAGQRRGRRKRRKTRQRWILFRHQPFALEIIDRRRRPQRRRCRHSRSLTLLRKSFSIPLCQRNCHHGPSTPRNPLKLLNNVNQKKFNLIQN